MKTQIELARDGITTEQMQTAAADEKLDPEMVRDFVAKGQIVIPNNPFRKGQKVVGIGRGLSTKVNASIGTSSDICDIDVEVRKVLAAEQEGADTLMELFPGGDLDAVRRAVMAATTRPVGNVPLYQAFKETSRKYQNPARLAVHIGDLSKYPERRDRDKPAAMARRGPRWDDFEELLLFPDVARSIRDSRRPEKSETCTMCGDFCAMKKGMEVFNEDIAGDKISS